MEGRRLRQVWGVKLRRCLGWRCAWCRGLGSVFIKISRVLGVVRTRMTFESMIVCGQSSSSTATTSAMRTVPAQDWIVARTVMLVASTAIPVASHTWSGVLSSSIYRLEDVVMSSRHRRSMRGSQDSMSTAERRRYILILQTTLADSMTALSTSLARNIRACSSRCSKMDGCCCSTPVALPLLEIVILCHT